MGARCSIPVRFLPAALLLLFVAAQPLQAQEEYSGRLIIQLDAAAHLQESATGSRFVDEALQSVADTWRVRSVASLAQESGFAKGEGVLQDYVLIT
ncbi:MAG: hypothetical protein C0600_12435, partial [Ignavibacteria bacterium]